MSKLHKLRVGSKTITFLGSLIPRFYFTYNFYWFTTSIKGRLLSSMFNNLQVYSINQFIRQQRAIGHLQVAKYNIQ